MVETAMLLDQGKSGDPAGRKSGVFGKRINAGSV